MSTLLTLTLPRPHDAQRRIKREARRFNAVACGRRFGKTVLGEDLLVGPALDGYPVAYFAPTYKMLAEVWRDVRRVFQPVTASVNAQERRLQLITGGIVDFWSLDSPDVARGRKYKRVVIDEAAMIAELEPAWQEVLRPTLTDYEGDAWFLSTPKGFNFFHTLYQRGQDPRFPDYASWQMPSSTNPHLPPAEFDKARGELPERVFNQEYLASFVDDASAIFHREWWRGQNRYDALSAGSDQRLGWGSVGRYISWDTALKDTTTSAYTACTVAELMPDYRLAVREVWRDRLTFPELPNAIQQVARRYQADGKLRGVLIEDKASGTSAIQTLRATAEDWLVPLIQPFLPSGNKSQRAEQAAVWCRNGCVLLPEPSAAVPWLLDFEEELFLAPQAPFMDQVDSFSQLLIYLEHLLASGWHARGGTLEAAA